MSDIRFDHQEYIHLLWLVPLLAGVFMYGFWRKRRGLRVFATANLHEALVLRVSPARQRVKAALALLALALAGRALAGPRGGGYVAGVQSQRGALILAALGGLL